MGRIAEALKRAEQQRRTMHGVSGGSKGSRASGGVGLAEPLFDDDAGNALSHDASTAVLDAPDDMDSMDPAADSVEPLDVRDLPRSGSSPVNSAGATAATLPANAFAGMDESVVAVTDPSGIVCEQYRGLRTRLLSQNPDNEHRVVGITSSIPRDGKSVTALNTAFILAEIRHLKVLVVDGDFRRSSLAKMMNVREGPGLSDLLLGEAKYDEVLQKTPLPNLSFIAAGSTHGRSAAEVLSSKSAGAAFASFRSQFHYTIIDTPPAATVSDVGVIGQWCHGVIMVVRVNKTPEPMARRAIRVLQVNNVPVIGTIIVGHERPTPGYGYYRYYNYYRNYKPKSGFAGA